MFAGLGQFSDSVPHSVSSGAPELPQLWQRGLWFTFAFLGFFLDELSSTALSPVMLIVALIMALIGRMG